MVLDNASKLRKATCKIVYLSVRLVFHCMYVTFRIRRRNIIGFANSFFSSNIKYLYHEMENYTGLKVYFVTPSRNELDRLKSSNVSACYYWDIRKIILFVMTDVWINSHSYGCIPYEDVDRRFNPFYRKSRYSIWVDVWHGVGFKHADREKTLVKYDLGFVTSDFLKEYYSEKAPISGKLKITGFPRTDPLIKKNMDKNAIMEEIGIPLNRKNILFAPTYGHGEKKPFFPWERCDEIIEEIDQFCEENDCNFLIRMHVLWDGQGIELKGKNVFHLPLQKWPDTQLLLYITNVLVTDWSSIANDFILLDRPIIFLDVDFPVQEFLLKPEERVGYVVKSKTDFFQKMQESITNPELFKEKRKILVKKIYRHLDGNSSRRCAREIIRLLVKKQ